MALAISIVRTRKAVKNMSWEYFEKHHKEKSFFDTYHLKTNFLLTATHYFDDDATRRDEWIEISRDMIQQIINDCDWELNHKEELYESNYPKFDNAYANQLNGKEYDEYRISHEIRVSQYLAARNEDEKHKLKTMDGFFYGSVTYDELYYENIVKVKQKLTELLAFEDKQSSKGKFWIEADY